MTDPRLKAYLAVAAERPHPFYARQAWRFAVEAGDEEAIQRSLALGALNWRPEPVVKMRTEAPRALDLFCGAGGAARGLQEAGYEVTGVDTRPQPRYAGDVFIQADAMALDWAGYDLIWASPPCEHYSELTPAEHRMAHPDLLPEVLRRLRQQTTPYIVENVAGARRYFHSPIVLCGSMFGLPLQRHRWFEIGNANVFFLLPPCNHSEAPVLVSGRGMRKVDGRRWGGSTIPEMKTAMGIDWMIREELRDAIPPAYSRFLAEQVLGS